MKTHVLLALVVVLAPTGILDAAENTGTLDVTPVPFQKLIYSAAGVKEKPPPPPANTNASINPALLAAYQRMKKAEAARDAAGHALLGISKLVAHGVRQTLKGSWVGHNY